VSRVDARRIAIVLLLFLVAVAAALARAPLETGSVRLAGVSLVWWYAGVIAPLLAAALAVTALVVAPPSQLPSPVVWSGPLLLLVVATRVLGGSADVAFLAVLVLVASLIVLLAAPERVPATRLPRLLAVATVAALVVTLGANLRILVDVGAIVGLPQVVALVIVVAGAGLLGLISPDAVRPGLLAAFGLTVVCAPVAVVAFTAGEAPWTAWRQIASRSAMTFAAGGTGVTAGVTVIVPTTLTFSETHRVTAAAPGVFRVSEQDGTPVTTRDWRLAAGESLTLRAGDRLSLPSGARVRFEAGKRVPGAVASGITWADPPERRSPAALVHAVGLSVALMGGALVLAVPLRPVSPAGAVVAVGWPVLWTIGAVCWGLYAAYAVPDIALGMPGAAGMVSLPERALGGAQGHFLTTLAAAGLLFLALAGAAAARRLTAACVGALGGQGRQGSARLAFVAVVGGGGVIAAIPFDAWQLLVLGFGFAAATVAAPLVAARTGHGAAIGSLVGALIYLGMLAWGWHGHSGVTGPVLVAAPCAWAMARLLSPRPGRLRRTR